MLHLVLLGWAALCQVSFLNKDFSFSDNASLKGHSSLLFPAAGFFLGLVLVGVYHISLLFLGHSLACLFAMLCMLMIHGSDHLKSCYRYFCRCSPLKAGNRTSEASSQESGWVFAFPMMLALLAVQWLSMVSLGSGWVVDLLLLAPAISAWTWVYLSYSYSRQTTTLKEENAYIKFIGVWELVGATVLCVGIAITVMEWVGMFVLIFIFFSTSLIDKVAIRQDWRETENGFRALMKMNEVMIFVFSVFLRKGLVKGLPEGVWI